MATFLAIFLPFQRLARPDPGFSTAWPAAEAPAVPALTERQQLALALKESQAADASSSSAEDDADSETDPEAAVGSHQRSESKDCGKESKDGGKGKKQPSSKEVGTRKKRCANDRPGRVACDCMT